ncbi:PQQ-like beta-propeller repeat protein [bacterium]|nr:PQQ-like beta-propeller repeat protein [bacterium]
MDYRERWQQRRRKEARRNYTTGAAILAVLVAVIGLVRMHRDGRPLWCSQFQQACPIYFTPSGNLLYCALPSGEAVALRLDNGRRAWKKVLLQPDSFGAPPAVSAPLVVLGDDGGRVTAYDAGSATPVWQFCAQGPVRSPLLISDGVVFFGSDGGQVHALELASGRELWRYEVGAPVNCGAVLCNGVLVVGAMDGSILGIDAGTGTRRWDFQVGASVMATPALISGQVIVGADNGTVYQLDPMTGRSVAKADVPESGLIRSAPVVDASRVYVATTDGWLMAMERTALGRVWSRKLGREISAGPAIDDTYLYCATGEAEVLAIDKKTGRIRKRWDCPARVEGSLVALQGMIVASTADGQLIAFRTLP